MCINMFTPCVFVQVYPCLQQQQQTCKPYQKKQEKKKEQKQKEEQPLTQDEVRAFKKILLKGLDKQAIVALFTVPTK